MYKALVVAAAAVSLTACVSNGGYRDDRYVEEPSPEHSIQMVERFNEYRSPYHSTGRVKAMDCTMTSTERGDRWKCTGGVHFDAQPIKGGGKK